MSLLRFPFGGPRTPEPLPVVDGVPCRPYRTGEHAATISAMLLRRLIVAAVAAAVLSIGLPFVVTLLTVGTAASSADVPVIARIAGSPLAFACYLLVVDYLLVRGRLARTLSILTWTRRRSLSELREATGLRRATDRAAARDWLARNPHGADEPETVAASRVRLQVLAGDLDGARQTVGRLPREDPEQRLRAGVLEAGVNLAAGQPFDAEELRAQVDQVADGDRRAGLAVEVASVIAQGRFTCQGDHIEAMARAFDQVEGRDAGLLLRAYWLPIILLVLVTAAVLAFVVPVPT